MGPISAISALIERLETIPDAIADCVAYEQDMILSLKKDELLHGVDPDGLPLTPGYTEDFEYFNSRNFKNPLKAADSYYKYKVSVEATHKARIEHVLPYPEKGPNTPNFRYTRDHYNPNSFHDQMWIRIDRDSLIMGTKFIETSVLNAKYGTEEFFSLGPGAKMVFWNDILSIHLQKHILGQ
jgi:hypothetical protein